MDFPKRKPNRLTHYNYSAPGAYFITLCTEGKKCILGSIVGGGALDAPFVQLSKCGNVLQQYIESGNMVPGVTIDKYVVMPNHVHMILLVDETASRGTSKGPSPANAVIPHFVSTLKRFIHREIGIKIFQRSYHDHVIRGIQDYQKIWQYMDNNPAKWENDCFHREDSL